jgi:hypothetical protein
LLAAKTDHIYARYGVVNLVVVFIPYTSFVTRLLVPRVGDIGLKEELKTRVEKLLNKLFEKTKQKRNPTPYIN